MADSYTREEYDAMSRANDRMMDTTIWEACRILGIDTNEVKVGDVFHQLFERYYEEELRGI